MKFDNSYARLPAPFFARCQPTPVRAPGLIKVNEALATELGLDPAELQSVAGVAMFAGNRVPAGAEPIALAYAGHQFGNFVPSLGDGRAILLGEVIDRSGTRRDLQLKGSGRTPFSRGGDGRAGLGPVLREYLVAEAMYALGVPTTRALAAVTTGERVIRESPLPGAVLCRVATSHIRVGTFEYFAARQERAALQTLLDYAIARHLPEAATAERPALAFLAAVIHRQTALIARWLSMGFIHGVMNTDNTTVSGETIDYGPCAFMDNFDDSTVFSSIDRHGRYAYGAQPAIIGWNLARLGEALLPLVDPDGDVAVKKTQALFDPLGEILQRAWRERMAEKLGLTQPDESDEVLIRALLQSMGEGNADYTNTFRALAAAADDPAADAQVRAEFAEPALYDRWAPGWRARLAREPGGAGARMRQVNPAFIPRNHRVEAVISAAVREQDFAPFEALLAVVTNPYAEQPGKCGISRAADARRGRDGDILRHLNAFICARVHRVARAAPAFRPNECCSKWRG